MPMRGKVFEAEKTSEPGMGGACPRRAGSGCGWRGVDNDRGRSVQRPAGKFLAGPCSVIRTLAITLNALESITGG